MKKNQNVITIAIPSVSILTLLMLVVFFQWKHDALSPPFTTRVKATTRNLIKETTLPYVTFGFKNFITDLYWIRAVQDLISWDGKDLYYLNYFRNMSALDPSFEYPYLFDILVVPQNKNIDVLNAVGEISDRGIQAIPTSWKIPFYLGTQYYLFTRKYEPAEHYLGVAAKVKGAPEGVYLLYATYAAKKVPSPIHSEEDRRMVQELVKVIYNNTDNETIKKIALKGLQEAAITQMIEKGVFAYKVKYKKYPTSLNDLINAHLVSLPEAFLENFSVKINPLNGRWQVLEKVHEGM